MLTASLKHNRLSCWSRAALRAAMKEKHITNRIRDTLMEGEKTKERLLWWYQSIEQGKKALAGIVSSFTCV